MMYTVRDLIKQAYTDSNVIGRGGSMSIEDLTDGIALLNRLLGQRHSQGSFHPAVVAMPVVFSGKSDYSIGPLPDLDYYPMAPVPDVVVNVAPGSIKEIVFYSNQARLCSTPVAPGTYFSRGVNQVNNPFPSQFYYERTAPLAYIRFMYGTPSGNSEIIYEPSYLGVDSNTDVSEWNQDLVAFLAWQVASDVAAMNRWDNAWLQDKANKALSMFESTNRRVQAYCADLSAPGRGSGMGRKWNSYTGELV